MTNDHLPPHPVLVYYFLASEEVTRSHMRRIIRVKKLFHCSRKILAH